MLNAGIPILEIIDSMLDEAKGKQKIILTKLKEDLNQGQSIYQSFANFPKTFDPVIINLIKAAEEAGTLEKTLKDITLGIKKNIEFVDKIKAALIYPILVFIIFIGVILVILVFVIPRVATVFTQLKIPLPLPTRILIFSSKVFVGYYPIVIAVTIMLTIILLLIYRAKKVLLLNLILSLPLLSRLAKEIDLTQFTRTMSLVLMAGMPITDALDLSQNIVNKLEIKQAISNCLKLVSSGKKLTNGLNKAKNIFPTIMIVITEAGEKSGSLENSMNELAEHFDLRVSQTLKTLVALFEPLLLIIIGLLVGGVMLAIIAPIYGLISQIGAR
ncbi:hypothetical protein A3F02_03030 [Candidatus Curtissbacteria bacterium RIFCSPHIGHO2_12_FULL_38_9b]|uniref:Type II secretion system protein GspF domain-containing protein n=1 Tax=Candidatus Curtissbacteria bacterium RIFCSPHIGHO2_12_FULL_38_9b TaxID=1797720 RepID=A0A1F5GZ83_9BACT|nr:MAG: hypothetical protein A3F02_03030 [Candidatus Curtissbacteria bacterium RIFCSPHIGHO2_12_FULL_38_9b]